MNPKEMLEKEKFLRVYEWHDNAGIKYPKHTHKGEVALFIVNGDITFHFPDNTTHTVHTGERFDVPVGIEHSAIVGQNGCDYVVGEMIEGDS